MDWRSFLLALKENNRFGAVFVLALLGFFGLVIAAEVANSAGIRDHLKPLFSAACAATPIWACRVVRRARKFRRDRFVRQPLSCDELRVARSKLGKP